MLRSAKQTIQRLLITLVAATVCVAVWADEGAANLMKQRIEPIFAKPFTSVSLSETDIRVSERLDYAKADPFHPFQPV